MFLPVIIRQLDEEITKKIGLRFSRLLVVICLLLVVCLKAPGVLASPLAQTMLDFTAVDAYIETQMEKANIPGVALAVIQGEEIILLQLFYHKD